MDEIAVREIARTDYAAFLESVPHCAFHRLAWLDAVVSTFALRVRFLGYFQGGTLIAVTPLMGRRIGPLQIWGAPLRKSATPAATPFCSPTANAAMLLPSLHGWIKSQRLNYAQITLPGSTVPPSDMADKIEPLDNLELNLQPSLEKLWKSLSTLPQRCIRKAVKAGVRIHWCRDSTLLADQRLLVAATYGRQGIHPNIPESLYETLLQHQSKTGLRVLCATHGGKTVASVWVFTDTRKCYYWDAAALAESRDLNANHLLVWTLIRWAHRKRFQILDFVGTSVGGRAGSRPGIGRFKQSMGARAVEYRVLYWHSPLMRLALDVYRRMQRLRARLHKK